MKQTEANRCKSPGGERCNHKGTGENTVEEISLIRTHHVDWKSRLKLIFQGGKATTGTLPFYRHDQEVFARASSAELDRRAWS